MNKMYVITASGGQYDDAWQNNVCIVPTLEAAEAEVQRLQDLHAFCLSVVDELKELRRVMLVNPLPEEMQEPIPDYPRGEAKMTKAAAKMHQERIDAWRKLVQPIEVRNAAKREAAEKRISEATIARARELGCTDEHIAMMGDGIYGWLSIERDINYGYEELEVRA